MAAAKRIGFPVVTKPLDGNHGRGVGLDIRTERAVRTGFKRAVKESRNGRVVVESFVTGSDYRVLVIGGRMVAIAQRVPAHVIGDGKHTVAELVEITNQDPRRGIGHEKVLTRIKVDDAALDLVKKQGFDIDGVPPKGEMVKLADTGNMSTGGISIDRTWEAHEDNVEIAEEAARVVGLDVAGIDFLAPDIAQPVRETGGAIVEVNAAPGFRMHTHPTEGEPQYVAKHVVDLLFPPGTPARIPIVAVTGSNGKTTTTRMIAHIFRGMGRQVGVTSTDGIYIDERLVKRVDASGPKSALMVLQNPRVDMAIFEVARGGILREGLGYERNDVGVVLNVTGDHLGLKEIDTLEQLAAVKQVVVEAVPRSGYAVLNADDPLVLEMRRHAAGNVILFTMAEKHDLVERWVRRGRKAVVLERSARGEMMVIKEGRRTMPIAWIHTLPATFEGKARMMVQNAMAAAAAAHAAGAHLHDIRQGLRSFTTSVYQAPGRLNLFDLDGVKVLLDYAHNAAGLEAVGDFVERMTSDASSGEQPGAATWTANIRVAVVATAGDRRDEDMYDLGRVAARYFDEVIIREDRNPRGRPPGETAALILEGVRQAQAAGGARAGNAEIVLDEMDAARMALDRSRSGRSGGALRGLRDGGVQGDRIAPRLGIAGGVAGIRGQRARRGGRWRPRSARRLMAHDTDAIARALEERRRDLQEELASLTAVPRDPMAAVSFGKRIGDGTTEAVERLNKVGTANSIAVTLADVERALEKLRDGTYGTCDSCGESDRRRAPRGDPVGDAVHLVRADPLVRVGRMRSLCPAPLSSSRRRPRPPRHARPGSPASWR